MKTAICYFSGTGNSFDIAQRLQAPLGADLCYIPNTAADSMEAYERIVLVSPIFSFGLPIPTKDFIKALGDVKGKHCYAVLHYGGFSANAAFYTRQLFEQSGLDIRNIYKLKMPESFTLFAAVPEFFISSVLKKSVRRVNAIADSICKGEERAIGKNIFAFCDEIHEKNSAKWANLPDSFTISADCDGCGHCRDICPAKNIALTDKPAFGGKCVACLACYQRCPKKAINYGKKTIGKKRYRNPNVDFSKMK